jgi:hypothetical protein
MSQHRRNRHRWGPASLSSSNRLGTTPPWRRTRASPHPRRRRKWSPGPTTVVGPTTKSARQRAPPHPNRPGREEKPRTRRAPPSPKQPRRPMQEAPGMPSPPVHTPPSPPPTGRTSQIRDRGHRIRPRGGGSGSPRPLAVNGQRAHLQRRHMPPGRAAVVGEGAPPQVGRTPHPNSSSSVASPPPPAGTPSPGEGPAAAISEGTRGTQRPSPAARHREVGEGWGGAS